MNRNLELARIFGRIADALELRGETGFRVLAYRRAALTVGELADDVAELDRAGTLTEVPGIGRAIAAKIHEYLATGKMHKHQQATAGLPETLFALLELQGVGPKTVKLLHDRLGVNDTDDLRRVIGNGSAAALPGMGPKRVAHIEQAISLRERTGSRMLLDEASELAAIVVGYLGEVARPSRTAPAGSLRRGVESVGDVDVLVATDRPAAVVERFLSHPDVHQQLAHGATRASALFRTGQGARQVDLRVVPAESWGAALQYFTGSKAHNVKLRTLARRHGLKISEYGVFRGRRRIAGRTEEEVYAAVGLPLIEPELREDRGEIEAAESGRLPRLVRLRDIRGDLHVHTDMSDGSATAEELVAAARSRGYTHLAIADHSVSASYAGGLTPDRLLRWLDRVDRLNRRLRPFRILKSCEVDIRPDGRLDYDDRILERLDLVIASVHQGFRRNVTDRIRQALCHPFVHMVAHPSGRLIGRREGYEVNLEQVIDTARHYGKILEINAYCGRLDLNDIWAREAKEAGVKLAVNTDAHAVPDLGWMRYGVTVARRAWLGRSSVVNCLTSGRLLQMLQRIRGSPRRPVPKVHSA